jgi:hypothetical protein
MRHFGLCSGHAASSVAIMPKKYHLSSERPGFMPPHSPKAQFYQTSGRKSWIGDLVLGKWYFIGIIGSSLLIWRSDGNFSDMHRRNVRHIARGEG